MGVAAPWALWRPLLLVLSVAVFIFVPAQAQPEGPRGPKSAPLRRGKDGKKSKGTTSRIALFPRQLQGGKGGKDTTRRTSTTSTRLVTTIRTTMAPPLIPTTTTTTTSTLISLAGSNPINLRFDVYIALNTGKAPRGMIKFCTTRTWGGSRSPDITKGVQMLEAYSAFLSEVNKVGGIRIKGNRYNPSLYVMAAPDGLTFQEWAAYFFATSLDCDFFLGPTYEDGAEAMAPLVQAMGKIMVSPMGWSDAVFQGRPNIFGLHPPAEQMLKSSLKLVAETGRIAKVAYHYQTHTISPEAAKLHRGPYTVHGGYAEKVCSAVDKWAAREGIEVVARRSWKNVKELFNVTEQIAATKPDLVVACVLEEKICGTSVVPAMSKSRLNPYTVILAGCMDKQEYLKDSNFPGRFILAASRWATSLDATSNLRLAGWTNNDFLATMRKSMVPQVSTEISVAQALAWSALDVIVWAIETAGDKTTDAVATVLRNSSGRSSIAGILKLNQQGRHEQEALTIQWQQQPGTQKNPSVVLPDEKPAIVAPADVANRWPWFPRPAGPLIACYRSDVIAAPFGYPHLLSPNVQCHKCPPGQLGTNSRASAPGYSQFGNITVRVCKACPAGEIMVETKVFQHAARSCRKCPPGRFSASAGSTVCKSCEVGHFQPNLGHTACLACPPGTYQDRAGFRRCRNCTAPQVAVNTGSRRCFDCPVGAVCSADSQGLQSQYWNEAGWAIMTREYYDADAWVKHDVGRRHPLGKPFKCATNNPNDVCRPNNVCFSDGSFASSGGPMCGKCSKGYEKTKSMGSCRKCPPVEMQVVYCGLNGLFMLLMSLFAFGEGVRVGPEQSWKLVYVVLFKQVLNYSAIMYAIRSFVTFRFKDYFIWDYLYWSHHMGSTSPNEVETSTACLLREWFPDHEATYSFIIMAFVMVPLWMLVDILVFLMLKCCFAVCSKRFYARLNGAYLSSFILIQMHVNLVRVTRMFIAPYRCMTYDVSRLLYNTEIQCRDVAHVRWQAIAAIGIVTMCCTLPIALYFVLSNRKHYDKLGESDTIIRYGYFYIGYTPQCCSFFESVMMIRKIIFIVVPVLPIFVSSGTAYRYYASEVALLCLVVLFMFINYRFKPYDHRCAFLFRRVESAMLMAVFITLAAQAFITATDNSDAFSFSSKDGVNRFGLSASDRKKLRDILCFFVVMLFHFRFLFLVSWGLVRPVVYRLESFKTFTNKFFGIRYFTFTRGGMHTEAVTKDSGDMFASICESVAYAYMRRSNVFNFQSYTMMLQHICTDGGYWTSLQKVYGNQAGFVHAQRGQLLLRSDVDDELLMSVMDSLSRLASDAGDDMMMEGRSSIDWHDKSSAKAHVLQAMTDFNQHVGKIVSVEELYAGYLRTSNQIDIACRLFAKRSANPEAMQMDSKGHVRSESSNVFETSAVSDIRRHRLSDVRGATFIDDEEVDDIDELTLTIQADKLRAAEAARKSASPAALMGKHAVTVSPIADTRMIMSAQEGFDDKADNDAEKRVEEWHSRVKGGAEPLSQERVYHSHFRRLMRQLNAVYRENIRMSTELAEFAESYHEFDEANHGTATMGVALDDFASRSRHIARTSKNADAIDLKVTIGHADFVVESGATKSGDKVIASCSIAGRPLIHTKTRFSTPPVKDMRHPKWDHTGILYGCLPDEGFRFELRSIYDGILISYANLPYSESIGRWTGSSVFFEGDLTLERAHTSLGKGGIGLKSINSTLWIKIECEDALSKRKSHEALERHASAQSLRASLRDTVHREPSRDTFRRSMGSMVALPQHLDDETAQAFGEKLEAIQDVEDPGAADEEEDPYEDLPYEANDRVLVRNEILRQKLEELRSDIRDVERDLAEEPVAPSPMQTIGMQLQVLSSKLLYRGSPDAHLQVGAPIGGASAKTICKEVEVQTDFLQHADDAYCIEDVKLKAEMEQLMDQSAKMDEDNYELTTQIQTVHDELLEMKVNLEEIERRQRTR